MCSGSRELLNWIWAKIKFWKLVLLLHINQNLNALEMKRLTGANTMKYLYDTLKVLWLQLYSLLLLHFTSKNSRVELGFYFISIYNCLGFYYKYLIEFLRKTERGHNGKVKDRFLRVCLHSLPWFYVFFCQPYFPFYVSNLLLFLFLEIFCGNLHVLIGKFLFLMLFTFVCSWSSLRCTSHQLLSVCAYLYNCSASFHDKKFFLIFSGFLFTNKFWCFTEGSVEGIWKFQWRKWWDKGRTEPKIRKKEK